jgi:hypothetical protein
MKNKLINTSLSLFFVLFTCSSLNTFALEKCTNFEANSFEFDICNKVNAVDNNKKYKDASTTHSLNKITKTYQELINIENQSNNICNYVFHDQHCKKYLKYYKIAIILQQIKESGAFASTLSNKSHNFSSIKYQKLKSRISFYEINKNSEFSQWFKLINDTSETENGDTFASFLNLRQALEAYLVFLFTPIQYRDGYEDKYSKCFDGSASFKFWMDKSGKYIDKYSLIKEKTNFSDQATFLNCIAQVGYAESSSRNYGNYGDEAFTNEIGSKLKTYLDKQKFNNKSTILSSESSPQKNCFSKFLADKYPDNPSKHYVVPCGGSSHICVDGSLIPKLDFCKDAKMKNMCPNINCTN